LSTVAIPQTFAPYNQDFFFFNKFISNNIELPSTFFLPFYSTLTPPIEKEPQMIAIIKEKVIVPTKKEVIIREKQLDLEEITIKRGEEVTWKNAQQRLPVLLRGMREINAMKSSYIQPGESFSWTFSEPGTYTYVDGVMIGRIGKIIVQ